jgi:outer membrane lipoprotein
VTPLPSLVLSLVAWLLALVFVFLSPGCSPPAISRATLQQADRTLSIDRLLQNPDTFQGRTVLLGGEIIETGNAPGMTSIIILERHLDSRGKPRSGAASGGRFIVRHPSFLDPAIFRPGRIITVAGVVIGSKFQPLGEISYRYPLIENKELYLWPEDGSLAQEPSVHFGIDIGIGL